MLFRSVSQSRYCGEFVFVLEEGHKEEVAHDEKDGHNHEDGDKHEEVEGKTFHFQRIEVKTGTSQLGYTQVTLLQKIEPNAKIVFVHLPLKLQIRR